MKQNNINNLKSKLVRREWRLQQQQIKAHERRKEIMIKEYEILQTHRLKQSNRRPLFKGPEGTEISSTELRKIKVVVYRNVPGKSAANELERDIVNPENVVVKRRTGEGSKPIFEREELTKAVSHAEEVEERRTVATVEDANLENKPKRRSASLSLTRNRSYSHRRTSFRHSRYEDYKLNNRENRRSNSDRGATQSCHGKDEKHLNERSRRDPSRSRERDETKLDRNARDIKSVRGRSRERRMSSQQIPIPIYYGNFSPRTIMVGPLVPIHGHVAFGGSRYPMWPMRPFVPRFPPGIDMSQLRPPGNPRGFKPQY